MKNILEKLLNLLNKTVSTFVLLMLLLFAYVFFYKDSIQILWLNINNPIKSISTFIDDSLLYNDSYTKHNNDVVIIKIDEKTLNAFSKTDIRMLSFPKELYSNLVIKLIDDYEVSIIGFDVIFLNKSQFWEKDEDILKDTFDRYNEKIVIWSMSDWITKPLCKYNNVQHWSVWLVLESRIRKTKLTTDYKIWTWCDNLNDLYSWNKSKLDSFAFVIYKKYIENLNSKIDFSSEFEKIKNNNYPYFNINFFHNWERNKWTIWFKSYSLIDVLNWEDIDLEWKIVLVWEVWTALHDSHYTPNSPNYKMPWVEINANLVMTLLTGFHLNDFDSNYLIFIVLLIGILIYFLVLNNNIIVSFVWLIVIILANITIWLFVFTKLWLLYPIFMLIFYSLVVFFWLYLYKFVTVDKNKRFLKKAFSMYVSSDMVNKISANPKDLTLKWHKWNITVFFSDIAWFTSISEKMDPELLFDFLNRYFSKMTQVLISNRWTLDKYIWDWIMWFFNAPLPLERHEFFACKCALEQITALKLLNEEFAIEWLPELSIRIWINTWDIIHGNLWARWKRLNYTIIWDEVNLGARLESVNKIYWTNIIVSGIVFDKVSGYFVFRELDHVVVKWKEESVFIYELLCFKGWEYDEVALLNYSLWLKDYYIKNYKSALNYFSLNSNDRPSIYMIWKIQKILNWELDIVNWIHILEEK